MNLEKIKQTKTTKELLEFGIINIDKPSGPTSFQISDFVRKTFGLKKTSHFGTLDPRVTGVLPIALGRACKLTGYFLGEDKEYVGIMRLHEEVDIKKIQEIINKKFIGKIKQTPPVRSSVKRVEREREVKRFELIEQDEKDIVFIAEVEGGTYIRKLITDLGEEMNIGAHMLELRRIRAGIFLEDHETYPIVNLYDLEKAFEEFEKGNETLLRDLIIPGEVVANLYPNAELNVNEERLTQIFTGKPIYSSDLKKEIRLEKDSKFVLFNGLRFIGIYKYIGNEVFGLADYVFQPISR